MKSKGDKLSDTTPRGGITMPSLGSAGVAPIASLGANATVAQTKVLKSLLDGEATFQAMKDAVQNLAKLAPEDHDTLITAFGLIIHKVTFQQPHTFIFSGVNQAGDHSSIVAHYSQVVIQIVHLPHQSDSPREVGFHCIHDNT